MSDIYKKRANVFKALADAKRVMITDMLSCNEMCACNILEKFEMSQSTLSHHMKILRDCSLVNARKVGKWTYYSLNDEGANLIKEFFGKITSDKENCICKDKGFCDKKCDNDE